MRHIIMAILLSVLALFIGFPNAWAEPPSGTIVTVLSSLQEETFLPWNGSSPRKFYLDPIYEYLIYTDPDTDALIPGLAEKWEMSDGGKVWTFYIRKGVPFHEGWGEVTAEDVKYTIDMMKSDKSIAGPSGQMKRDIVNVEAPEPYKVVITLGSASVELDREFFGNGMPVQIVSKKYVEQVGEEKANAHPIGTGPYTLAKYTPGLSIELTTIPDVEKHWRVVPKYKNIKILGIPEESARVAMLKAGEADLAPIAFDSVPSIKASGLRILSVRNNWAPIILFGGLIQQKPERYNANAPWTDQHVRQALNYAIDREAIARHIFGGEAIPAAADMMTPEFLSVPAYPYNAEKARQLLKEAGYPDGFQVTLKTCTMTPGAELPVLGQAIAMYWSSIGLDVKVIPTDYGTIWSEWTGGSANNMFWTQRGMAGTSILTDLNRNYTSKFDGSFFSTVESETMVENILKEVDPKKRSKMVRELAQYLHDQAFALPIVYVNEPFAVGSKITSWPTIRQCATCLDQIR